MGHICKADGRVSNAEIDLARSVMAQMDLSPIQARTAMRLFNEGKAERFPLDAILTQLRAALRNRSSLARMFIEIQMAAACADGNLDVAERRLLLHVCDRLGFSPDEFEHLEAMAQAEARHGRGARREEPRRFHVDEAFAILNLKPTASNDEVKRAYRRLMNQHHPDKLLARGLPEEMMRVATEKTREIREAYERIREARGF
jgi:DnaJ like chaperone protein